MKRQDLTGYTFGKLTVLALTSRNNRIHWVCKCECGKETIVNAASLKGGHTKSCGCLKGGVVTHGQSFNGKVSSEFTIWASMIDRCTNVNSAAYPDYGGRGITVCDRWLNSFDNFFTDMGNKPSNKYTLDREDNNGDYELSNCRWATRKVQNRNTRRNVFIEYEGVKRCLSEWAEILNLKVGTLYRRIVICKLPIEKAFTAPIHYT